MPITNNASYVPTMNEFAAHWAQVNTAVGTPLLLKKNATTAVSQAEFVTLRQSLEGYQDSVIDKLNEVELERGNIRARRVEMLRKFNELMGLLDGYYAGTPYMVARPKAPNVTDAQVRFLAPLRDAANLWSRVNADAPPPGLSLPLTLADGTTQGAFQTEFNALRDAFASEAAKLQDVDLERARRNAVQDEAHELMKKYRMVAPSAAANHPTLVETLPRLTPEGGHTPEPVNASAVFEAPDKVKVVYDASADNDLARYELRGNPGDAYDEGDAVVIATNQPGDPREFVEAFGLTQPGARVAVKVFVVLTTGNEAGSPAMVVERPV